MSVSVMALVFKARLGCVYRKAVALKLADCADDDGRNIWPAVATIAEQSEVSERTVQNKLHELVALGLIEVVKLGGGAGHTTCYRFHMDHLHDLARRRIEVDDAGEAPRLVPVQSTPAAGENPAPGAPIPDPEKGAPGAPFENNPAPGAPITPQLTTEKGAPGAPDPSGTTLDPSSPPQPPAVRGERRGRDRGSEIEQIIHSLRTERPQRGRVIDLLLAPVVLVRKLDAPSVSGALASLADWGKAERASDAVLTAAAAWLLETRNATVKPADFQSALKSDHVRAADQVWLDRHSPEWWAWVRHLEVTGKRSLVPHIRECTRWAFPSRLPPESGAGQEVRS